MTDQPQDEKQQDKVALRASQAGMRFIAQMTIYNSENYDRLRTFIADSYHDEQLEQQGVDSRLQVFRTTMERVGKMRVKQVMATNEHHIVVIMETQETDDFFYVEMQVEEDYPHKITHYVHYPLQPVG